MLAAGVYPASVTPFTPTGEVDESSLARLLARFEAAGCAGVVLAGTNGEGPSLSAIEKRDMLRAAMASRGRLKLVLGIATPSLHEAEWLAVQSGKAGAEAVRVMPPSYFRSVTGEGVASWFLKVADASPVPLVVYNYPKMTGIRLSPQLVARLASHPNVAGFKDSSGEVENLEGFREAAGDRLLFVGDETLLLEALRAGWTGTISGAANVVPEWLARIVGEWASGSQVQAETLFEVVLPVIEVVRKAPQPTSNKAVLHALGVIESPDPRLPLERADPEAVLTALSGRLGVTPPGPSRQGRGLASP